MIFAVLPVKDPRRAKERLQALLTPAEREALARSLYQHVIAVLTTVRSIDRLAVATSDEATARDARRRGLLVFEESEQVSHSRSADAALRQAAQLGAATVLLLPVDVPLLAAADVEELASCTEPGLTIVPSTDGTGTNALVHTPPGVIPCRFGPGSFRAHYEEAQARGVAVQVRRPPGLVFDLDTPEDAARLLAQAPDSAPARLLRHAAQHRWTQQPA